MKNTAILLLHGDDQKGIVAAITDFLLTNNGNVVSLDEHVDSENHHFFMRIEWELIGFNIPKSSINRLFKEHFEQRFKLNWVLHFKDQKPRIGLMVSKYAHCFFDILSRVESNEWNVEISLIMSNHDKFEYVARRHDIPFYHIPISKENKITQEQKQLELLKKHQVDLVVMARYMQILSDNFINQYPNRIINIHHSSLPAFAGSNPYGAAYARGVKIMGATAHYATTDLDEGPIIAQDVTAISHVDSIQELKRKGKDIEKIVLAKAIWVHINHKIISYQNKTVVFS